MACCRNIGGAPARALGGDSGDDRPRRLIAAEKGKKVVTKKRKIADRDTETARVVVGASKAAEAGCRRGILRIGSELSSTQRCAVFQLEQQHGSSPGTVTVGGR
jgi:hypothetical protein